MALTALSESYVIEAKAELSPYYEQSFNTALILIDVQYGFLSDYTWRCIPGIERLLAMPFAMTIATKFVNVETSMFTRQLHWHMMMHDCETDLYGSIACDADAIVNKTTYGCSNELASLLDARDIRRVVLAGMDTDVCVLQNAAQLFDKGFIVSVAAFACASNGGPAADAAALDILERTVGASHVWR